MGLVVRGIVWFGLYFLLVLTPLGVALLVDPIARPRGFCVELGAACGFIAFSLLVLECSLVSRLRAASAPFGTDVLMQVHRLMGLAALGFVVAHPLLLLGPGRTLAALNPVPTTPFGRAGTIAVWAVVVIVLTSVGRRRMALSYEAWQRIHGVGALVVVVGSLVHARDLGTYARSPVVAALLVGYGGLFAALMLRYRVARPLLLWRQPWRVVQNRDDGASTRTLVLAPPPGAGFAFDPGQFVWLDTGRTPFGVQQHPITIASSAARAPDEPLELSIKALGDWSSRVVPTLEPGVRVWVDGPYGAFTPEREPGQGFVLIAGGIGITPMRSILLTMRDRGDRRVVVLVYAARSRARVVYRAELEALRHALALEVVYVLEEPDPGWRGERGLVTADVLRRHLPAHFERFQYFACGPPPMLDAIEELLPGLGVPAARIHTERFDVV